MTDDKDELIRELADKVKALEEKDKNRISTPWGVYDQKTFNLMFWGGMIIFTFAALFVAYIVTSDNPFGILP
jgi:type VI protein secretion system component VasF